MLVWRGFRVLTDLLAHLFIGEVPLLADPGLGLHAELLVEALLLFETVLVEDRGILDFVDADYTWLNARLAARP